jgi:peptide/nickel transport system substrate-binding protein
MILPSTVSAANQAKTVPNKDTIIEATIGEPETVDPAWAYDTSSAQIISNMYECLVGLPRETIPDDLNAFDRLLATDYTISPDGLTYTFDLRTTATFHDGSHLDASDVEYAIERGMVLDHVGGPQWMLLYPLTNHLGTFEIDLANEAQVHALGVLIDNSVTVTDADTVVFHLAFPYVPFMQILTQSWASIYDKDWALALKAAGREFWGGTWGVKAGWTLDHTEWVDHNDNILGLSAPPMNADGAGNFAPVECGSGPYKLNSWVIEDQWSLNKYDAYWRGWPAPGCADFVAKAKHLLVTSWPTRKLIFLSNAPETQADIVNVPRQYISEVVNEPGVRHAKNWPTMTLSPSLYFNFEVASTSVYFGVKPTLNGLEKRDLWGDMSMRKGVAYAINYAQFIIDAFKGEAQVANSPISRGMNFYNASKPTYNYDLNMAKYYFKMAYGGVDNNPPGGHDPNLVTPGTAWTSGFTSPICYNTGNTARRMLTEMIKKSVEQDITGWGVAPTLDVTALPWGTVYIPAKNNWELPIFALGWLSDFADPDNNVATYIHSSGDSARFQNLDWGQIQNKDFAASSGRQFPYTNWEGKTVTGLNRTYIDWTSSSAGKEGNPAIRQKAYEEISDAFYALAGTLLPANPLLRNWERDWVQGAYYNIIGQIAIGYFYYWMWKGVDANMNLDGKVDQSEVGLLNAHWHDPPFYVGDYSTLADISYPGRQTFQCREMDGDDYVKAGADAKVNLADLGLVKTEYLDFAVPNP